MKKINILCIVVFILMRSYSVQAEIIDPLIPYIMESDLFTLNEMYRAGEITDSGEAKEILKGFSEKYSNAYQKEEIFGWVVVDEEGNIVGDCFPREITSSGEYDEKDPWVLVDEFGVSISLDQPKEELEKFIQEYKEVKEKIKREIEFLKTNFSEMEYGGYYTHSDGIKVLLVDMGKTEILEKQGIEWEKTDYSLADMYEELQWLWENKEVFGIGRVHIGEYGKIGASGSMEREAFLELNEEKEIQLVLYDKLPDVEDDSYTVYASNSSAYFDIVQSIQYKEFDEELEKLISGISYQQDEKNPFMEEFFGDPERISLKILLTSYKDVYPEKSYQQLYDTYAKDVEEECALTHEEKLHWYTWKTMQIQKHMEEEKEKSSDFKDVFLIIGAGTVCMLTACLLKKSEILYSKHREKTAD